MKLSVQSKWFEESARLSTERGEVVAHVHMYEALGDHRATAERLAACWNLCESLSITDILAGPISLVTKQMRDRLLHDAHESLARLTVEIEGFAQALHTAESANQRRQLAARMESVARSYVIEIHGGGT